jgi:hypothetical protein
MLNNGSHIKKDIYNQTKYWFIMFLFSLDLYYSLSLKFIIDYIKNYSGCLVLTGLNLAHLTGPTGLSQRLDPAPFLLTRPMNP